MTHLIGQQLGRYVIQAEIGRGGMAFVYRALDRSLQRTVAIKVLAPQLALDTEFIRRFDREAITAANLRHPNIVTVYDVGEHNGLRYIAMEFVRGRTLHAILKDHGGLGLGYATAIIGPVASALDYAHSQGAVHRDVKPQNILIDLDGRVLLTDFGIAQGETNDGAERLTRTGMFMGTPEYISPEQASARVVDGRSDLYSLGIATYEVVTGMVPFSGTTLELIRAHAESPPPPPSNTDISLPPELDLVLARALAKRPESRFGTGSAFVEALRIVARKYQIPLAQPAQLAALVPEITSAGQDTVSLGRGPTPRGVPGPAVPPVSRPSRPPDPVIPPPRPLNTPAAQPRRPPPPPPPAFDDEDDEDVAFAPRRASRSARPVVQAPIGLSWPIIATVVGALVVVLVLLVFRGVGATGNPFAPTLGPRVTALPTLIPTIPATLLPAPTMPPTQPPVPTDVPPTEAPQPSVEPPTETLVPVPPTEVPPTTVPPTEVPTEVPTEIPTEVPTEIPTEVPTEIPTEVPTATSEPPTATNEPPTTTPSPTLMATAILSPTVLPTLTPTLTLTHTRTPTVQPTVTLTPTVALTPTLALILTPSATVAPSATLTPSATITPSATVSPTMTPTPVAP